MSFNSRTAESVILEQWQLYAYNYKSTTSSSNCLFGRTFRCSITISSFKAISLLHDDKTQRIKIEDSHLWFMNSFIRLFTKKLNSYIYFPIWESIYIYILIHYLAASSLILVAIFSDILLAALFEKHFPGKLWTNSLPNGAESRSTRQVVAAVILRVKSHPFLLFLVPKIQFWVFYCLVNLCFHFLFLA